MTTGKRERYFEDLKAKVAPEAIRGKLTIAQLVSKHGAYQTMINAWKKRAVEGMTRVFSGKAEAAETARAEYLGKLHANSRQLVVARFSLSKTFGR